MCVVSMVYDHFNPLVPQPWIKPWPVPSRPVDPLRPIKEPSQRELDEVQKIIDDFKKAREAAEQVDTLIGQRDCVDPEKAKLEQRVKVLEEQLEALRFSIAKDLSERSEEEVRKRLGKKKRKGKKKGRRS